MSFNVERLAIVLCDAGPCERAWQTGVLVGAVDAGLDLSRVGALTAPPHEATPEPVRRAIAEAMLPLLSVGWSPPARQVRSEIAAAVVIAASPRTRGESAALLARGIAVTVVHASPEAREALAAETDCTAAARALVAAGRAQGDQVVAALAGSLAAAA